MDTRYAVAFAGLVVLATGLAVAGPVGSVLGNQATAAVSFSDQAVAEDTVEVDGATLPDGGFLAVYETTDDNERGDLLGVSELLDAGTVTDVPVELDEAVDEEQEVLVVAHPDRNGDGAFDVPDDESGDTPYTSGDVAVADTATLRPLGGPLVVTDLQAPTDAVVGQTLEVTATVANEGEQPTTQQAEFRIGGTLVSSQEVTVEEGEEQEVTFRLETSIADIPAGEFRHGVFTRDDGQLATINISQSFVLQDLQAPEQAPVNDTVTVNASVANPNEVNTTQPVEFRFDGAPVDSAEVSLGPGETTTVALSANTTGVAPGNYTHGVLTVSDGAFADIELTETVPPADNQTEPPVDNETAANETAANETAANETEPPADTNETEPPADDETAANETAANVTLADQATGGETVVVERVVVPEGGFVVIHDETLLDGNVVGSVIGASEPLEAGVNEDVEVTLFEVPGADFENETLNETQSLIAMPHRDTNDNGSYDFVATDGEADGPYTDENGDAVVDDGEAVLEG